ncbi:hypothetical protein [Kibdelosporangium aridum]|nr:hypothetical protein [Kibdelosporangium aridum]
MSSLKVLRQRDFRWPLLSQAPLLVRDGRVLPVRLAKPFAEKEAVTT